MRPELDEAHVKALIDAWLDAQNHGDFAAYQGLYGERFAGVKRSGAVTARFGRTGWLADRKGMFSRPMHVEIAKLTVVLVPGGASVRFEQTWSSGNYKDVGPKQMLLLQTGAGARIVREELLESVVEAASRSPVAVGSFFLADEDGIVITAHPESCWEQGRSRRAGEKRSRYEA